MSKTTDKTSSSDLQAAIGDELYQFAKDEMWIPEDMSEADFKTRYAEQLQNMMNRVADRLGL